MVHVSGQASVDLLDSDMPVRPEPPEFADRSIEGIQAINQRLFETSLDLIMVVDRWATSFASARAPRASWAIIQTS